MELGFYSLGEWLADPLSGHRISAPQRLGEILDAGVLAEELCASVFGVGEHHARHWVVSSPAVVLGALAARTRRIRLASTVSLLATLDPVRVAQDYATVDVISGGRLDLMIGKGIAAEPYALFDVDIEQQRDVLAEHLHLLRQIWATPGPLRWKGRFRPPIVEHTIHPRPDPRRGRRPWSDRCRDWSVSASSPDRAIPFPPPKPPPPAHRRRRPPPTVPPER